ncbi:hypothetical protein HUK81_04725 [Komagataeibacter swingsii]|uniref:Uncharacterized protein n=1 Tax=Komagataeibacter swingsii TaxID=215220 RepID=A0A850P3E7_9PROT|nr:hypothetical protein [Komagataeibacter swingsii]
MLIFEAFWQFALWYQRHTGHIVQPVPCWFHPVGKIRKNAKIVVFARDTDWPPQGVTGCGQIDKQRVAFFKLCLCMCIS